MKFQNKVLYLFQVFDFFKRRIEQQYPLPDGDLDPYQQIKEQHESFMKNRSENVMGREEALQKVGDGTWWCHQMETVSALLALCAGNSPVTGEFPSQRPVTRSFDVFFDLRLNKRLSKQSWSWWFEIIMSL